MHFKQVMLEGDSGLSAHRPFQRFGSDKGVAIAITANP